MKSLRFVPAMTIALFLLAAAIIFCLLTGYTAVSISSVWYIIKAGLKLASLPPELQQADAILFDLRWPRIWTGVLVGGALSVSGCVFQGLLRNPLADPYILGVSAGAVLGAAIALILKLPPILIPLSALIGGIFAIFLVYLLAVENRRLAAYPLLLAGVIVNFFFSAALMFLMTKSGRQLPEIINLLMGSLAFTAGGGVSLSLMTLVVIGLSILLGSFGRELNLLALGDEQAQSMGVDVNRTRQILFGLTSALVGLVVSLSGIIGFVGLVVPHTVRLIVGPDVRRLIPLSFVAGSIFLILCDTAARSVSAVEVPVGVITAFFGAPFFIWLLKFRKI